MTGGPISSHGQTFGNDAATYHRYRPGYPDALFAVLRDHCGLAPGVAGFEIGAGTGQATRVLLREGVDPLTAIEPDARLAAFIADDADRDGHSGALDLRVEPFEDTVLENGAFDLGMASTSLHWLDQASALRKAAMALRPGGWWAAWWSMYGDPRDRDAFSMRPPTTCSTGRTTDHTHPEPRRCRSHSTKTPDAVTSARPAYSPGSPSSCSVRRGPSPQSRSPGCIGRSHRCPAARHLNGNTSSPRWPISPTGSLAATSSGPS